MNCDCIDFDHFDTEFGTKIDEVAATCARAVRLPMEQPRGDLGALPLRMRMRLSANGRRSLPPTELRCRYSGIRTRPSRSRVTHLNPPVSRPVPSVLRPASDTRSRTMIREVASDLINGFAGRADATFRHRSHFPSRRWSSRGCWPGGPITGCKYRRPPHDRPSYFGDPRQLTPHNHVTVLRSR